MHSDVLVLKLWFAVHRMLQSCATNYVSFSLTGCGSFMGMGGLAPLAPDKLRPSLPHVPPPFLFHSFSFQIDEVFIRCGLFTVMYTMGLQ